jgi:hypothetical protein
MNAAIDFENLPTPTPDKPDISVVVYEPGDTISSFMNLRVADIRASHGGLSLVVRLVPLVVGLVLELARCLAMTLGLVGVAEHVGHLGRLALAARRSLVSRGGAVMRSALAGALVLLLGPHLEEASAK